MSISSGGLASRIFIAAISVLAAGQQLAFGRRLQHRLGFGDGLRAAIGEGVGDHAAFFRIARDALRRVLDRRHDVHVAGTAADIALEFMPDGLAVHHALAADHIDRGHDHARGAEAALQAVVVAEGFLHTGCSLPSFARPSMVVTCAPCACTANMVQDFTALPSICTTQAPHWLVIAADMRAG